MSFFFEDAPGEQSGGATGMAEASGSNYVVDFLSSSEGLQLNRAFVKIARSQGSPQARRSRQGLAAEAEGIVSLQETGRSASLKPHFFVLISVQRQFQA